MLEHEATVSENRINDNNQKDDKSKNEMQNQSNEEDEIEETESLYVQKDRNGLSIDVKCACKARFVLCYVGNESYTISYFGRESNDSIQKDLKGVSVNKAGQHFLVNVKCSCNVVYTLLFSEKECFYKLSDL